MKKFIPFILLAASASSSLLLAENENRLKATNQVTGCRLQVEKNRGQATGNRLQVRDTNQGIEYRLQGTGLKTAELPLEDQIGQRAEITTNYELRTANCDNQDSNLDCHPMMNPE
ncbi:MAG TPA: hypothetical protein VJK54_03565, partial [Chthoniobacterales bacterium]|nr:hypothetical protein [Chthoniobacterales bacterium]